MLRINVVFYFTLDIAACIVVAMSVILKEGDMLYSMIWKLRKKSQSSSETRLCLSPNGDCYTIQRNHVHYFLRSDSEAFLSAIVQPCFT